MSSAEDFKKPSPQQLARELVALMEAPLPLPDGITLEHGGVTVTSEDTGLRYLTQYLRHEELDQVTIQMAKGMASALGIKPKGPYPGSSVVELHDRILDGTATDADKEQWAKKEPKLEELRVFPELMPVLQKIANAEPIEPKNKTTLVSAAYLLQEITVFKRLGHAVAPTIEKLHQAFERGIKHTGNENPSGNENFEILRAGAKPTDDPNFEEDLSADTSRELIKAKRDMDICVGMRDKLLWLCKGLNLTGKREQGGGGGN